MSYHNLQYALKILANSMYGALSFAQYNTYSPRCGMSITAIGRWSLTVASCIIASLGLDVIYGDTDSVMFCLPSSSDLRNNTTPLRASYPPPIHTYISRTGYETCDRINERVAEILCDSKGLNMAYNSSLGHLRGLVPKLINKILSYTCVNKLLIEHESTGHVTEQGIHSSVRKRFLILKKKNYVSMLQDYSIKSKGVSYVRRTGAALRDDTLLCFVRVALEEDNPTDQRRCLAFQYKRFVMSVNNKTPVTLFHIRQTVGGKTGNYLKIAHPNINYISVADFSVGVYKLDQRYYTSIIMKSLDAVCRCIGWADSDSVTAGIGYLTIHGV